MLGALLRYVGVCPVHSGGDHTTLIMYSYLGGSDSETPVLHTLITYLIQLIDI